MIADQLNQGVGYYLSTWEARPSGPPQIPFSDISPRSMRPVPFYRLADTDRMDVTEHVHLPQHTLHVYIPADMRFFYADARIAHNTELGELGTNDAGTVDTGWMDLYDPEDYRP